MIAASIVGYFKEDGNREIVERLRQTGLQFQLSETQLQAQSNILEGHSIVISGVFLHHSRDEYKRIIEQHGGKNVGSISKSTSFILAGDNMGPSKLEKAQKLGIKIMNEEEFLELVGSQERPDKPESPDNQDKPEKTAKPEKKTAPQELSLFDF